VVQYASSTSAVGEQPAEDKRRDVRLHRPPLEPEAVLLTTGCVQLRRGKGKGTPPAQTAPLPSERAVCSQSALVKPARAVRRRG